jgi:dTDP-4-amino-4,6-dideoxygalactose transaminase
VDPGTGARRLRAVLKPDARVIIPIHRPSLGGRELDYVAEAVAEGLPPSGGRFTTACRDWLERELGARKVILTASATAALEVSALLCDITSDDEVVLPSFTYVATANAFLLRGARLRFIDIRPDTLTLDEGGIAAAIGPRTRVIVPVHYAGIGAAMDEITRLTAPRGIRIVEDAAQGLLASHRDRHLGTIGHLGVLSFHATKNVGCGQGGALLVNDARFDERADALTEEGTDRTRFRRGEVPKYSWVDVGSTFLLPELAAAFLRGQLEAAHAITARRRAVFDAYLDAFAPLARRGGLGLPVVPPECRPNAHLFYLLLPDHDTTARLAAWLARAGIQAVGHYVPLHTSPMGRRLGYRAGDLPVTEDVAERLLRLPCWADLPPGDQERVVAEVERCLRAGGS